MKVSRQDAVDIFVAIGHTTAPEWPRPKLEKKLNLIDDIVSSDVSCGDRDLDNLLDDIIAELGDGTSIEIDVRGDGKKAKTKPEPVKDDEDDFDDEPVDEVEEEVEEEDEPILPRKSKKISMGVQKKAEKPAAKKRGGRISNEEKRRLQGIWLGSNGKMSAAELINLAQLDLREVTVNKWIEGWKDEAPTESDKKDPEPAKPRIADLPPPAEVRPEVAAVKEVVDVDEEVILRIEVRAPNIRRLIRFFQESK
jgi:hypothetical protein